MDTQALKRERDDVLRRIANVAGLLPPALQAELNGQLNELATLILKKREEEERGPAR
jgi:hypothetical protein